MLFIKHSLCDGISDCVYLKKHTILVMLFLLANLSFGKQMFFSLFTHWSKHSKWATSAEVYWKVEVVHQPVEKVSLSLKSPFKFVLLDSTNKQIIPLSRIEIIACIVKMLTLYVSLTKIHYHFFI